MAVIQGTSGYFWAGAAGSAASVGYLNRWTVNLAADTIDVSVFGNRWKDNISGSVGWTGSIAGFCDLTDTGQIAVETSLTAGTSIDCYFFLNGTNYRYGTAYVTGVTTEDTHNGVVTFSADVTGDGELYKKSA
jgi:predicted secreted protein